MPRPYSMDLRERVVRAALAREAPQAELAHRFAISEATLQNWLHRYRTEGTVAPRPHSGGQRPSIDAAGAQVLTQLITERNDRTLAELRAGVHATTGVRPSQSAVWRMLEQLDLRRKKSR